MKLSFCRSISRFKSGFWTATTVFVFLIETSYEILRMFCQRSLEEDRMILSSTVSLQACLDAAAVYVMRLSDCIRPAFNIITFEAYFCTVGISTPCIWDDYFISACLALFLTLFWLADIAFISGLSSLSLLSDELIFVATTASLHSSYELI